MTVAQLIEELESFDPDAEAVVVGYSWVGSNEPKPYEGEPDLTEEGKKIVIRAF